MATLSTRSRSLFSRTDGSSTLADTELGHRPSSTSDYSSKPVSKASISTTLTVEPPRARCRAINFTKIRKATRLIAYVIAAAILFFLFDAVFVVLAYYASYSEIYFNSKVAIDIRRNSHTDVAFKFFLWLFAIVACIPNGVIGYQVARVGLAMGKSIKMPLCILYVWMLPWAGTFLAFLTVTLWIRTVITGVYHTRIFNHGCTANGWDWDVVLNSSSNYTLLNTLPVVGTANISSTRSGTTYTAELIRHEDNQLRFDFTLATTEGPLFPNITYDWENQTYMAWGPNSTTNINGTYVTSPKLSFQSLNLSLLDDSIPFQRPGYHCWPAAATLVLRNSTSQYFKVLQSLTLDPRNKARMKVCGMAGSVSVDEEFQISLGVVFVNHFYYSLCSANQTVQYGTGDSGGADGGGSGGSGGNSGFDGGGGFSGGGGFDGGDEGGDEGGEGGEGGDGGGERR